MELLIIPAIALALLIAPLVGVLRGKVEGARARSRIVANLCIFAGMCVIGIAIPIATALAADEGATAAVGSIVGTTAQGLGFIAAGL
ncbi:MAG: hypothetical protein LBC65_02360, partial [Oscillospiraceae bacterium]|nr:hypothetical protein [Oscillospiraceae bacterium]